MSNYLIIGASGGIGNRLATLLADSGNHVVGTYNTNPITSNGKIQYQHLNVLDEIIHLQGLPESIHGLVYCPGAINLRPFDRLKPDDFVNDYNLQVVGAVKVIQAALTNLKQARLSSIILFSTVAVQAGLNFHSQVSSTKGAVEGLTRALAAEFAPGIRVNCIAPSLTDTPLAAAFLNSDTKRAANAQRHPLKRIGTTEDIARMAEYLLSEKAGWITGQVFHVDGGLSSLKI
jgi:NAD(P)-dependent dehydrogenase (short-subunit alcohol dehydrogenase family)